MKNCKRIPFLIVLTLFVFTNVFAQNPIVRDQFTADPSARVFNGKVYLFPSHDIPTPPDKGLREEWFCMEDYHVFSSSDLMNWEDHGVIVTQSKVDWVDSTAYNMWAPDCIEKDGKYYFYFPAGIKKDLGLRGSGIGVAIANKPEGPYVPEPMPIKGVSGIDPNPFIDKDGQAYLYWSAGNIFVAKLKDNMLELDSEVKIVSEMPTQGLKEGPYVFERNGIYYMTYPHVEKNTERLEYAIGDNPMGPFKFAGVIMDEHPSGCWTNHHSFIEFEGQWYLFYHHNDYSPNFDKNRSARIDKMYFNADGTIQKVIPTLRGVGISNAKSKIEIDRYSKISNTGASIALHDTINTFKGWETILESKNAWVQYNDVDFGKKKLKTLQLYGKSTNGSTVQIRLDSVDGPVLAEVKIPQSNDMKVVKSGKINYKQGVHNLFVVNADGGIANIDWVQFK
jgi:beta-xylosidase